MGYAVYRDPSNPGRWAGYAVPAECDWPDCTERIYRGMDARCEYHANYRYTDATGNEVGPGGDWEKEEQVDDEGCYLHFCEEHLYNEDAHENIQPKGDSPEWKWWLIVAPSWAQWRIENPETVAEYRKAIKEVNYRPTQSNLVDLSWDMEDCGVMTTENLESDD